MSQATKTNKAAADDSPGPATSATISASSPQPTTVAGTVEQTSATEVKSSPLEEEPLCLEYATPDVVPLHLRQILEKLNSRRTSSAELLMLLNYVVALECGFVDENTYMEQQHLLKPVPAVGCFHIVNVRLLSQLPVHYSRESADSPYRILLRTLLDEPSSVEATIVPILQSRLTVVVLGDLLLITISPMSPSKDPGYSICLSIGRFVLNVQLEPLYKRFRKLDELSLQLRQKLFQPMRDQQLQALKLQRYPSLLGLPLELYDEIFRFLTTNQLNILANVNRQLCTYSTEFKNRR